MSSAETQYHPQTDTAEQPAAAPQVEAGQSMATPDVPAASSRESGPDNSENRQAQVVQILEGQNKSRFERMSDKAKEYAGRAYEGLYKIPVVNRVVAKVEIAYKQFWADRHEEKAVKFKGKIESINQRDSLLVASKNEIRTTIE